MDEFGKLLRYYRKCSTDPERGGALTQERLGELLGVALGDAGYTGAAISDWERGKSQIDKDQRRVLLSLIKVLHECGGLQTATEANTLLLAGNYRPFGEDELRPIFPETSTSNTPQPPWPPTDTEWRFILMSLGELIFRPAEELRRWLSAINGELPPVWSRLFLLVLGWPFRHWSSEQVLATILWSMVWLLTWWMTFPLLNWPFSNSQQAYAAVVFYASGTLIVPLLIGGLRRTEKEAFWQRQETVEGWQIRFFTYQGAYVGFHVGYMAVFLAALFGHYLGLRQVSPVVKGLVAILPLLISAAAAREVPFNIWRAFGVLRPTEGDIAIFSVFALLGPLWGAFFLWSYPTLLTPWIGGLLLLTAIGFLAALTAWQGRKGQTTIPVHVWVVIFSVPAILQLAQVSQSRFVVLMFTGVMATLVLLMVWKRVTLTLAGLVMLLLITGLLLLCFKVNVWVGGGATGTAGLGWWRWGKKFLWVPLGFWLVTLSGVLGIALIRRGLLAEMWTALGFGLLTLGVWWWEKHNQ